MVYRVLVLTIMTLLLLVIPPLQAQEAPFAFYGLRFGMTRQAVGELFVLGDDNVVEKPGHGISDLVLRFDRQGLLMEISASYPKPDGTLENIALKRALNEKMVAPVREEFPEIDVVLDEYVNRSAVTAVFSSRNLREENIEHFKNQFLKEME